MDYYGVNKKTYKNLKKEISEETAIYVGYYRDVIGEIPPYLLTDIIKEISLNGWITYNTSDGDLENMIVTEAVRKMGYQEFKNVAKYFFSFAPDDEAKFQRVQPVEITRENYEYLVNNTEKAFNLEKELENLKEEQNSLENKIHSLETKVVSNDNLVVGVDLENEQILLLKSPENAWISEDVVLDERFLNDYKSREDDYSQILESLANRYEEIELLQYEYILNNDTYGGLLAIDPNEIDEIEDLDIARFRTHKEYYEFAEQFESFNERYSNYEEYIENTFHYIYSRYDLPMYSREILEEKEKEINEILEEKGSYLVTQEVYGYSQGEKWLLGYEADETEDIDVEKYLENYIGAWYRGSLTELSVISLEAFEKGKYIGDIEENYYIDNDLLYRYDTEANLRIIQEHYPELKNFKSKEEVLKRLEQKEENKEQKKEQGKGRTI